MPTMLGTEKQVREVRSGNRESCWWRVEHAVGDDGGDGCWFGRYRVLRRSNLVNFHHRE